MKERIVSEVTLRFKPDNIEVPEDVDFVVSYVEDFIAKHFKGSDFGSNVYIEEVVLDEYWDGDEESDGSISTTIYYRSDDGIEMEDEMDVE